MLAKLGEVEKAAIDSFAHFADTMERIQGRPKIKSNIFSAVKLPNYEPEEIKALSAEVRMVIDGVVGAGVGGLAGLAAFGAGAGALVAAPAMAGVGVVLCVKGFGLKNKAVKNRQQAKQMSESVDKIVAFYADLRKSADSFRGSVSAVYRKYTEGLLRLDERLIDIFPEEAPENPSENLKLLTVRDVLCMGCGMDTMPMVTPTVGRE